MAEEYNAETLLDKLFCDPKSDASTAASNKRVGIAAGALIRLKRSGRWDKVKSEKPERANRKT
jgi:hypothetical protein